MDPKTVSHLSTSEVGGAAGQLGGPEPRTSHSWVQCGVRGHAGCSSACQAPHMGAASLGAPPHKNRQLARAWVRPRCSSTGLGRPGGHRRSPPGALLAAEPVLAGFLQLAAGPPPLPGSAVTVTCPRSARRHLSEPGRVSVRRRGVSGVLQSCTGFPRPRPATAPSAAGGTWPERHLRLLGACERPPGPDANARLPSPREDLRPRTGSRVSRRLGLRRPMPSHRPNLTAVCREAFGRLASAAQRPRGHGPGARGAVALGWAPAPVSSPSGLRVPSATVPHPPPRPAPLCSEAPETHRAPGVGVLAPRPSPRGPSSAQDAL